MSSYIGYTESDNARRKSNNLSVDTGRGVNKRTKRWTTSGSAMADEQVRRLAKKYKKELTVKEYSPEEIASYMESKKAA